MVGSKNSHPVFLNLLKKISDGIKKVIKGKKIDEKTLDELEELLLSTDLGVSFSSQVTDELRKLKIIEPTSEKIKIIIQKKIISLLEPLEKEIKLDINLLFF